MAQTTKNELSASLKKLLISKPLDKVRIQDITDGCGVNRQTFYYYFKDIYDLIEWSFIEEANKAFFHEGEKDANWHDGMLKFGNLLLSEKVLIMKIDNSLNRRNVERTFHQHVYRLMKNGIDEASVGLKVSEEDKEFIVNFYKCAFVGMVLEWIDKGMKGNVPDMVARFEKLMYGDLRSVLERFIA